MSDNSLLKVYSDRKYQYTTTIRHQGVTVAFAMDGDRRIYYSVLNLAAGQEKGEFDAAYWHDTPAELRFPAEIAEVGYAIAGATRMPVVKSGGRTEASGTDQLRPEEIDPFLSSTARLSAAAPFQVVSDDRYVVVFRQSVASGHGDAVFKLTGGGSSGDPGRTDYAKSANAKVPIVDSTLLCDRFLLVGAELKPVMEVRYQRSRHSTWPASSRDTPGTKDIEGKPFYEPTQELTFVRNLVDGAFSVLLLPTEVHGARRWQIFAHDAKTKRVESFNIEQSANGLFHTKGTRYAATAPSAETALRFDGKAAYVDLGNPAAFQLSDKSYTIEAWVRPAAPAGVILAKFNQGVRGDFTLSLDTACCLRFAQHGTPGSVTSTRALTIGKFAHVAAVLDAGMARLYLDGDLVGEGKLAFTADATTPVLIGAEQRNGKPDAFFNGDLDEIRIWNRARTAKDLAADRGFRLAGDEPGLLAYYRFDEGGGTALRDQSGNGRDGTLAGGPQWVTSDAPVGEHPGTRRDSFVFAGRTVVSGLSSTLYYQQEDVGSGDRPQPMKRQARVLLTAATSGPAPKGGAADRPYVAALDLAVGRDGRLARVPGEVTLPEVDRPQTGPTPEQVSAVETTVAALKAKVAKDEATIAGLTVSPAALVAQWNREKAEAQAELQRIEGLSKILTNWYYRILNLQENVYMKCDGLPNSWPLTVHSTKDPNDPKTLWRFKETMAYDVDETQYFALMNVVPDSLSSAESEIRQSIPICTGSTYWAASNYTPGTAFGRTMGLAYQCVDAARNRKLNVWPGVTLRFIRNSTTDCNLVLVEDGAYRQIGFNKLTGKEGTKYLGNYTASEKVNTDTANFRLEKVKLLPELDAAQRAERLKLEDAEANLARERNRATLLQEAEARLKASRLELTAKLDELARLTAGLLGSEDVPLPMPHLYTDRAGLGIAGGLLAFAWSKDTPFLFDSAVGHVAMYFRGGDGQFFSVYYDTEVSRAVKTLDVNKHPLRLVSRDPLVDLAGVTVEVSADKPAALCTVVITKESQTETFRSVPREVESFAKVLNGGPLGEPVRLGTIASVAKTVLRLVEGVPSRVPAGSCITVGGKPFVLASDTAKDSDTLTLTTAATGAAEGEVVRSVLYDYGLATASRAGAWIGGGSQLLAVETGTASGDVPNGKAKDLVAGRGSRWRGETPGRALRFDGKENRLTLPAAQLSQLDTPGDLTVETWALPDVMPAGGRMIGVNADRTRCVLTFGSAQVLPSAFAFDGAKDGVLIPPAPLADTDFTIEFWAKRARAGREDYVFSHGDTKMTTDHVLHLGWRANNTFTFAFWNDDLNTKAAYEDLEWHHWAAVFTKATREQILYRDGTEVGRRVANKVYAGAGGIKIGGMTAWAHRANARMDEVRVWNRMRTTTEMDADRNRRLTGREPGLLGYWSFTGRGVADLSGNNRDGRIEGNPPLVDGPLKGHKVMAVLGDRAVQSTYPFPAEEWAHYAATLKRAWAVTLDGRGYLDAGRQEAFDITGDLTIEVFLTLDAIGQTQGLVSYGALADGSGGCVPYQLTVRADGKLEFAFEEAGGVLRSYQSATALKASTFHRVAVTRKGGELTFYVDGAAAGKHTYTGPGPKGCAGPLEIGRARAGGAPSAMTGVLAEVRLWDAAREPAQVCAPVGAREGGLVAHWRMQENKGNVAFDNGGSYPAILRGARWTTSPDPGASLIILYRNGVPVPITPINATPESINAVHGDRQLTLGASIASGRAAAFYGGVLEEVRLWRVVRSREQILDTMFTRLRGNQADLIAYYTFDAESTSKDATLVRDNGPRANHLAYGTEAKQRPAIVLSTAPVSTDTAQVRSALASVRTLFHAQIDTSPAVSEYADAQVDARGVPVGVMKRCYAFQRNNLWYLITGYKVGELISEWAGQAQYDPQIIGFVEGAPPVPSENLTSQSAEPGQGEFDGKSTVEFIQADEMTHTHGTTTEHSRKAGFEAARKAGIQGEIDTILAPFGFGMSIPIEIELGLERHTSYDFTNTSSHEQSVSHGETVKHAVKVSLRGHWETAESAVNPSLGNRYVPANTGFAVVRSATADIFALRLAHNNALVSYHVVPSKDVPEDWNLIPFPLNPFYTKQGTLDGAIGANDQGKVLDPDYPQARGYGEFSYFKPSEAYRLIRKIRLEQQQLRGYYESLSTQPPDLMPMMGQAAKHTLKQVGMEAAGLIASALIPGVGAIGALATIGTMVGTGVGGMISPSLDELTLPKDTALADGFSRRNLVNTYVWTADGGFFAETTQTTDAVTEATTGTFQVDKSEKTQISIGASVGVASGGVGLDLTGGIGYTSTKTKKQEAKRTFEIGVSCEPSGDLQRYRRGRPSFDTAGKPEKQPGKVDAYRFVTFYLDTSTENFEAFFGTVIDPLWLEQSTDPNAAALRQAQQSGKKPPCWRIMHRVTYVSRVLPPVTNEATPPLEKAMRAEHIDSNYELIRMLDPYVRDATGSVTQLGEATRAALARQLPELLPHAAEIVDYLTLYYGVW